MLLSSLVSFLIAGGLFFGVRKVSFTISYDELFLPIVQKYIHKAPNMAMIIMFAGLGLSNQSLAHQWLGYHFTWNHFHPRSHNCD